MKTDGLNESWDGGVEGFREDNPFVRPLMNLDDTRKGMDSAGASPKSYECFEKLWEELIRDGWNWESENPEEADETGPARKPATTTATAVPDEEPSADDVATKVPVPDFITMLRSGIVKFEFEKKDGSLRVAYGTRNPKIISDVIGERPAGEGPKKAPRPGFITYFDMEKGSFRCFAEERFVGVVEEHAKFTPKPLSENMLVDFPTFTMIEEMLATHTPKRNKSDTRYEKRSGSRSFFFQSRYPITPSGPDIPARGVMSRPISAPAILVNDRAMISLKTRLH
jgi:hypothetical protein